MKEKQGKKRGEYEIKEEHLKLLLIYLQKKKKKK